MKIAVEIIGNEHLRVRGRSVAQWLSIWVIRWLSDATFEATCCGRFLIMVSNVLRPVSSGHASSLKCMQIFVFFGESRNESAGATSIIYDWAA